jgi:hypothetical protein
MMLPPGTRLLRFARMWFDEHTVAHVFEPLVADWQREWEEAPAAPSMAPRKQWSSPGIRRVPPHAARLRSTRPRDRTGGCRGATFLSRVSPGRRSGCSNRDWALRPIHAVSGAGGAGLGRGTRSPARPNRSNDRRTGDAGSSRVALSGFVAPARPHRHAVGRRRGPGSVHHDGVGVAPREPRAHAPVGQRVRARPRRGRRGRTLHSGTHATPDPPHAPRGTHRTTAGGRAQSSADADASLSLRRVLRCRNRSHGRAAPPTASASAHDHPWLTRLGDGIASDREQRPDRDVVDAREPDGVRSGETAPGPQVQCAWRVGASGGVRRSSGDLRRCRPDHPSITGHPAGRLTAHSL